MLFFQIVTICPLSLPSRSSRYPRSTLLQQALQGPFRHQGLSLTTWHTRYLFCFSQEDHSIGVLEVKILMALDFEPLKAIKIQIFLAKIDSWLQIWDIVTAITAQVLSLCVTFEFMTLNFESHCKYKKVKNDFIRWK